MFFASWNPVRLPSHQQIPAACRRLRLEAPACRAPDNPVRWDPSDASASWGLQQTLWWKWRYNGNIEGYIWIITDYNGIIGIAPPKISITLRLYNKHTVDRLVLSWRVCYTEIPPVSFNPNFVVSNVQRWILYLQWMVAKSCASWSGWIVIFRRSLGRFFYFKIKIGSASQEILIFVLRRPGHCKPHLMLCKG